MVSRIGKLSSYLSLFLIFAVCLDVVLRIFDSSVTWLNDLQWHLFSALFLLGGAYTFQKDKHVRVDLFYNKFSPKNRALVNIVGITSLLMPWCLILLIYTFQYALDSLKIFEGSPDPNGLPYRFIIKIILFLSIFLLMLQALSNLLKQIKIYKSH